MANFTPHEQLMLELINRARMDPAGEAARYGIALNEGVPTADKISTSPKQVLAGNDQLGKAADKHSNWMFTNDIFAHDEVKGTPGFYAVHYSDRETKAGYNWSHAGENIALIANSAPLDLTQSIFDLHESLFVDEGYPGRGHRVNILTGDFREVGVGHATGNYLTYPYGSDITTDFGTKGSARFVTGVVYDDTDLNDFFSVGEQTAGRTVSGSGASDTTGPGGGYELSYASSGSKTLTFDLVGGPLKVQLNLGSSNVKLDAVNGHEIWTNVSLLSKSPAITELHALGIATINLTGSGAGELIVGNKAANKLVGKGGGDTILGGGGKDTITGGAGQDSMTGGAKADTFVFLKASDSPSSAPDFLTDFGDFGGDKVDLKAVFSGTLTYKGVAAIDGLYQVNVTQSGADVIVHVNLTGDLADDMTITMLNTDISNIDAGDFLL